MKKSKVGILLVLLLLIGVGIMIYPAVSQYWNYKTQSRIIENYQDVIDSLSDGEFDDCFVDAEKYNEELFNLNDPFYDYDELLNYNDTLNISGVGIMGYITIEKLNVELPIYHGTSSDILNVACGHVEGSSLPVGGKNSHCVLSAHRGLPRAKLFTDLDKMENGDTFTITVLNRTLTYQVDRISVVNPDELDELVIEEGQDRCTLLTCTPYGINSHRLLVRGTRIENAKPVIYVISDAYKIDSLVATPVVAAPILLILLIWLLIKYRHKGSKPLISELEEE